jgi:hypothetical protein
MKINNHILGILKIGHNTREFSVSNMPVYSPNDMIVWRRLDDGFYSGRLGLFMITPDWGKHPGETIKEFVEMATEKEKKISEPRYELSVSEIIYSAGEPVEQNLYWVFSMRVPTKPKNSLEELSTINLGSLVKKTYDIHPGHNTIFHSVMTSGSRKNSPKPAILEMRVINKGDHTQVRVS